VVVHGEEPAIADSDAMGVAAQISIDLLGPTKGPLGVHDPTCLIQALAAATGGSVVGLVVQFAVV
jgi:hypothetical protein